MKLRTLFLTLGLLSTGSATALGMSSTAIAPANYYPGYTPTVLNYAATRGGMLTQVMGNPFEQVGQKQLEGEINSVMASSHFGPQLPFISTAPDDFASPYRIVVLFDPVQTVSAYKVCKYEDERPARSEGGTVRVHAVLCAKDKPLTSVSGQVSGVSTPSDPQFRQLIGQMTVLLFPTRREPAGDRRGDNFFS